MVEVGCPCVNVPGCELRVAGCRYKPKNEMGQRFPQIDTGNKGLKISVYLGSSVSYSGFESRLAGFHIDLAKI
jgi:hypothetical protein